MQILSGRKTDCIGTVLIGSDETDNRVTKSQGGYLSVKELQQIHQGRLQTLKELENLVPSNSVGDGESLA